MEALGVGIGLKTVCIVGGIDMFQQVTNIVIVSRGAHTVSHPGDELSHTLG